MRYNEFFRLLRKASKEYPFSLHSTPVLLPHGRKPVWAYALLYQAPSKALWDPLSVVAMHLNPTEPWLACGTAGKALGLSRVKTKELTFASWETRGHLLELRERLLKAVRVDEIPHRKRPLADVPF